MDFNIRFREYNSQKTGPIIPISSAITAPLTCVVNKKDGRMELGDTLMNLLLLELSRVYTLRDQDTTSEVFLAEQMCPPTMHNIYTDFDEPSASVEIRKSMLAYVRGTRSQRLSPDLTMRYSHSKLIFVPVNTGSHWTLGVIDREMRSILFFNTQQGAGEIGLVERILRFIGETLIDESVEKYKFYDLSPFIPQQNDSWSCGYHSIWYAQMMLRALHLAGPSPSSRTLVRHSADERGCLEYRGYLAGILYNIQQRFLKKQEQIIYLN